MKRFQGRPIFVCGQPRGATRMVANLVSSHGDVIRSPEIPRAAVLAMVETVRTVDGTFGRQPRNVEHWTEIRQDYFLNAIANTYKPVYNVGGNRFCNKTPSMELAQAELRECCRSSEPLFVYCARHPRKVLKSLANMPWNQRSVAQNIDRLHKSLRVLRSMREEAVPVFVAQLDKVGDDGRKGFAGDLMAFLELDVSEEVRQFVAKWPVAQPATKVLGDQPVTELTADDLRHMRSSKKYRDLCEWFGYEADE